MKRNYLIAVAIILIIGILFMPKLLRGTEGEIKFKVIEESEIPEKIAEVLPKYLMEERALTCKYKDDIYVVVTRGEKKSNGYAVEINKILKEKYNKDVFDIVVYAMFSDPNPNEIVEQEYAYPYIVVKTNLKDMPEEVHLDIEYVE